MSAHDDDARPHEIARDPRTITIATLNDKLRQHGVGGRIMLTGGVRALGDVALARAMAAVRSFAAFTSDNDPHGEHDFGVVEQDGSRILWKIDYYDGALEYGSPDPADPAVTTRVLTIMLAEEY